MRTRYFTARLLSIITIVWLAVTQANYAQAEHINNVDTQESDDHTISSTAFKNIKTFFGDYSEVSIRRYNQGLLEINTGIRSYFSSIDGRYLFLGKIIDTQNKIDISEQVARGHRVNILAQFDNENTVTFPATAKELFFVNLFTDIDCGYCRRFHSNMAQYNALGIRVNYFMLPRAGKHSKSYNKTTAVLCSQNPQKNITLAMQGRLFTSSSTNTSCQSNLDEQMLVANKLGISVTPTMLLPNGDLIEGALSPDKLLAQLTQVMQKNK
jgi:thiol:disulfide interchange protein DsbC